VHNLLVMGELNDLGDLTHDIDTNIHTQSVLALRNKVVEANEIGVILENQRRAEFVLGKTFPPQDALVLKGLQ